MRSTLASITLLAFSGCGSETGPLFDSAGGAGVGGALAGAPPAVSGTAGSGSGAPGSAAGSAAAGAHATFGGESAGGDAGSVGGVGYAGAVSIDAGAGGGVIAPPPRGGAAGSSAAGSSAAGSSAAGSSAAGSRGTSGCDGELYGGICWYLGGAGESCNEVCAPHGGVNPELAAYVGIRAQGGSAEACEAVLNALGHDREVDSGTRSDGVGAGCYLFGTDEAEAWWQSAPRFSPDASLARARLACGCAE